MLLSPLDLQAAWTPHPRTFPITQGMHGQCGHATPSPVSRDTSPSTVLVHSGRDTLGTFVSREPGGLPVSGGAQKPWGALFAQSLPSLPPCPVSLGAPVPKAVRPCPPGFSHHTDEEAGMGWVMPPQSLSVPWGAQGVPPALG